MNGLHVFRSSVRWGVRDTNVFTGRGPLGIRNAVDMESFLGAGQATGIEPRASHGMVC